MQWIKYVEPPYSNCEFSFELIYDYACCTEETFLQAFQKFPSKFLENHEEMLLFIMED